MAKKRRKEAPLRDYVKGSRMDCLKPSAGAAASIKKSIKKSKSRRTPVAAPIILRRSARIKQRLCRLLALPAELRISIYEYALTEDDEITTITQDLKPPGLLSTSRQIRAETRKIWLWDLNNFAITIQDCDGKLTSKLCRRLPQIEKRVLGVEGAKIWGNLMQWARVVWQHGQLVMKPVDPKNVYEVNRILSGCPSSFRYLALHVKEPRPFLPGTRSGTAARRM